ncbi:hypothetical protein [Pseudidiomarina mangrovi]|uniref:hypothetical protein n=1 Tax=Pseudidiomarina mangrovi TaxID=2487133 RepID=UPI000FCC8E01|nr:hypothetical protein [Pseudidiomarina mangrovi]
MKKVMIAVVLASASMMMNPAAQAAETSTIDYLGQAISQQANAVKNELVRATENALKQTMADIKLVFASAPEESAKVVTVAAAEQE